MDIRNCSLCVNQCSGKVNSESEGSWQGDAMKRQLKVVFLTRRLLEIPQDICCSLLEEYGDPCSWIDCCDSCSALIESGKHLLDQIIVLQKQFKALQNNMKIRIIEAEAKGPFDKATERVKELIRSSISQELNAKKLRCQPATDFSTDNIICVREEMNDSFVYPLDVQLKEDDALAYNSTEKDSFELDESGEGTVNSCDLLENKVEVSSLQTEPLMSFGAHFLAINEHSQVANSSNYINSQINEDMTTNIILTQERGNKNRFKCDVCGKCVKDGSHLKVHKRTHTGEKPFRCDNCGQSFATSSALIVHQRRHSGVKPYKCETCGKSFSRSGVLTIHQRIHTGEKPFQCNFCGSCFNKSDHLIEHQRTHTREQPYKCEFCRKTFSVSSNFTRHQKIHTRDKSTNAK